MEKDLQDKINTYLTEKAAEAKKLADAEEAKTTGRDNMMYALGLTFNGQSFVGYGRQYTKNSLYSLDQATYEALLVELEGLQFEQSVTGVEKSAPIVNAPTDGGSPFIPGYRQAEDLSWGKLKAVKPAAVFDTVIYDVTLEQVLPAGTRIILSKGVIANLDGFQIFIDNARVQQSGVYISVFKED